MEELNETIRRYVDDFASADPVRRGRARLVLPGLLEEWCELAEHDELLVDEPNVQLAEWTRERRNWH